MIALSILQGQGALQLLVGGIHLAALVRGAREAHQRRASSRRVAAQATEGLRELRLRLLESTRHDQRVAQPTPKATLETAVLERRRDRDPLGEGSLRGVELCR